MENFIEGDKIEEIIKLGQYGVNFIPGSRKLKPSIAGGMVKFKKNMADCNM